MRSTSIVRVAFTGLLLAGVMGGTALAQSFDKRTFFTFSGPVAVPGVTLPAGEYMFRVADAATQRNVLQVLSADGKTSYAKFFALRAYRPDSEAVPEPELRFLETAAGMPQAVKTWWYPSDRDGYEFIYPKEQLRLLTEGVPVVVEEKIPAIVPPEEPMFEEAPAAAAAPAPEPLQGEPAPESVPVVEPRTELPRTAGATPLIWMMGFGLLFGAGVLARFQR
jgi:hypothetical protein